MSNIEDLEEKLEIVKNYFKDFTNYIELEDFRDFLLFVLNSQASSSILEQLGMSGRKNAINLPWNPIMGVYYQKINLISAGSLIIYTKTTPISDKFILKKEDPIFKEFLRDNERELAFRGKEQFIIPQISDCTFLNETDNDKITLKTDDMYYDLQSFLAVADPNILFVLDGASEDQPDLIFAFNLMPEMPRASAEKVLKMDILLDYEQKTRGIKYLRREEDYNIKYLENLQNISHSDIFKASFSLLLHIKSFEKPY
ncbi:MAG: hypothetical protein EU547_04025 [Promethearchaeota archaeon]|nr:MAG: hypothetical protein EU547_04025 [Candidatus Lokiarchaeota archaeon]